MGLITDYNPNSYLGDVYLYDGFFLAGGVCSILPLAGISQPDA